MNFTVTPKMVQSFEIGESCMERFPCAHSSCKITLSDGRMKSTQMDGHEIYALINVIGKHRIKGNDHHHFDCYKKFKGLSFLGEKNTYSRPKPEEILSHIFKTEPLNKIAKVKNSFFYMLKQEIDKLFLRR